VNVIWGVLLAYRKRVLALLTLTALASAAAAVVIRKSDEPRVIYFAGAVRDGMTSENAMLEGYLDPHSNALSIAIDSDRDDVKIDYVFRAPDDLTMTASLKGDVSPMMCRFDPKIVNRSGLAKFTRDLRRVARQHYIEARTLTVSIREGEVLQLTEVEWRDREQVVGKVRRNMTVPTTGLTTCEVV